MFLGRSETYSVLAVVTDPGGGGGRSVTSRNGGLNFTMLRDTPTFMDTLSFIDFQLTDTVESVADSDWKKSQFSVVYIYYIQLWSSHIFTVSQT